MKVNKKKDKLGIWKVHNSTGDGCEKEKKRTRPKLEDFKWLRGENITSELSHIRLKRTELPCEKSQLEMLWLNPPLHKVATECK